MEMEMYLQPRVPVAALKEELVEGSAAASVVSRSFRAEPVAQSHRATG